MFCEQFNVKVRRETLLSKLMKLSARLSATIQITTVLCKWTLNCVYKSSTNNNMHNMDGMQDAEFYGYYYDHQYVCRFAVQPAFTSANNRRCASRSTDVHNGDNQPPCTNADNQPSRMMQNKSKGNILIYFSIFCWKTVQISCIVKFKEKWQVIYYLARVHTICYREWAYVCLSIIDERRRRKVK